MFSVVLELGSQYAGVTCPWTCVAGVSFNSSSVILTVSIRIKGLYYCIFAELLGFDVSNIEKVM